MDVLSITVLFMILFGITMLGFLVAVNSRGAVRMSISYVLATMMLVASVYQLVHYLGERKMEVQLEQAKEEARAQLEELKEEKMEEEQTAEQEEVAAAASKFHSIIDRGNRIVRSLKSTDVRDESVDIDTYFGIAGSAQRKAEALIREARNINAPKEIQNARNKTINGLQRCATSAKYLNLYFKSEDEDEEQKREDVFVDNYKSAASLLYQAKNALSNY